MLGKLRLRKKKKFSYKKEKSLYYNNRITISDNGNVQSHDQEESKLHSTINAKSGAHILNMTK